VAAADSRHKNVRPCMQRGPTTLRLLSYNIFAGDRTRSFEWRIMYSGDYPCCMTLRCTARLGELNIHDTKESAIWVIHADRLLHAFKGCQPLQIAKCHECPRERKAPDQVGTALAGTPFSVQQEHGTCCTQPCEQPLEATTTFCKYPTVPTLSNTATWQCHGDGLCRPPLQYATQPPFRQQRGPVQTRKADDCIWRHSSAVRTPTAERHGRATAHYGSLQAVSRMHNCHSTNAHVLPHSSDLSLFLMPSLSRTGFR